MCSDPECENVILTAGHGGLKFWDLRLVDLFLSLYLSLFNSFCFCIKRKLVFFFGTKEQFSFYNEKSSFY